MALIAFYAGLIMGGLLGAVTIAIVTMNLKERKFYLKDPPIQVTEDNPGPH